MYKDDGIHHQGDDNCISSSGNSSPWWSLSSSVRKKVMKFITSSSPVWIFSESQRWIWIVSKFFHRTVLFCLFLLEWVWIWNFIWNTQNSNNFCMRFDYFTQKLNWNWTLTRSSLKIKECRFLNVSFYKVIKNKREEKCIRKKGNSYMYITSETKVETEAVCKCDTHAYYLRELTSFKKNIKKNILQSLLDQKDLLNE